MSWTALDIRRGLLARLPWITSLEVEVPSRRKIVLHITLAQEAPENHQVQIAQACNETRPAGVGYTVSFGTHPSQPIEPLPQHLGVATLASDITADGLTRSLLNLVPALDRITQETTPERSLLFLVADFEGNASPAFLAQVRDAASAICCIGIPFEVAALPKDDPRGSLNNAGFIVARKSRKLVEFTERDQDVFAGRLKKLVDDHVDRVAAVDDHDGTSILCTTTVGQNKAPVGCFLPLYDRMYLKMPPSRQGEDDDAETYLQRHFNLNSKDFFAYCKSGKIVPVFKFGMGYCPAPIADRFIEDISLAMISPRELDYIAARYAWKTAEHVRVLRDDREASAQLYESLRQLRSRRPQSDDDRLAIEILESSLSAASSFEGIMWHKGHLQVADYSPAAPFVHMAHLKFDASDAAMASLDALGSSHTAALAQAFGSSVYDGMSIHKSIHEAVARFFVPGENISPDRAQAVRQLVDALELGYCEGVPAQEYLDLFDRAETRRVRTIVADLLESYGTPAKQHELRDAVQRLNAEVRGLSKSDLFQADVDVVGDLASGMKPAFGTDVVASVIVNALGLKLVKRVGGRVFDSVIEDTSLGGKLDAIRGRINGTSSAAIRLFRIRSRLSALRKG